MPEHLLPDEYSDTLQAEFMEFAMATDAELPPMDGGLDVFWATMTTRTTGRGDHPVATLSAVMKVYLLMPHSNADSERAFSMVNKIDMEHRSELVQDTIAALLSVKVNCTADTHSYEPATRDCGTYVQESHNELQPALQEHTLIAQSLLAHIF